MELGLSIGNFGFWIEYLGLHVLDLGLWIWDYQLEIVDLGLEIWDWRLSVEKHRFELNTPLWLNIFSFLLACFLA